MESFIRRTFLYLQLVWHRLAYLAVAMEPERFHSNLGLTYFNLGDFRRAVAQFEKSETVRHGVDKGFARYNSYYLGFSFMNLEEYPKALKYFEEYLRFKPDDNYVKEVIDWCQAQLEAKNK